ncbi:ABC transporter permease [Candidatus Filomicrobium marinum]|uniref:Phosphate transport system permease protein n=1 Tax=Candidatus Filomicrobium marinum TaxID=1608628 RepID=A0A0D6JDA1_9HYPH|nr:phosphate ABC transporter permease subunit PstC [Candidatus Filomicrobium marinum]CFX13134.1 ABC transporter permease [Candidatus Filomicrobium marinum]CPR17563.1 ABC transporter permease [Candidatus Filomicrobium marinum]
MSTSMILLGLLIAAALAYIVGIVRCRASTGGDVAKLHSRTGYYGSYLAIWTVLPALFLTIIWAAAEQPVIRHLVETSLPAHATGVENDALMSLTLGRINSVAEGLPKLSQSEFKTIENARLGFTPMLEAQRLLQEKGVILGAEPEPYIISAAYDEVIYRHTSSWLITGLAALAALAGFVYGFTQIRPRLRARNTVERVVLAALIGASTVAILTTVGIVFSVLFETIHFFQSVPTFDFFFGTVWDPRFTSAGREGGASGQFGLLPLLWGTLFISFVALAVAVPIGLYSAIYMSEYAGPKSRGFAKPLLEILAGIPTIVYGLFALITFGPFLRDTGAMVGLDIAASSVLTAGIVMGIMIIPFVSSLSDDIISAVPQSLREGSYGLGATKSETIRKVVLPAALPGIVGAVLLAASRAIGETMIVVLAAGIAANLTLNPFESVTTITVKIVSQLTGDLEFNSPQTLVAFALGLTLFVITLALNVYALYIVRKYREQYE